MAKAKPKSRKRRGKQLRIEGMEPESIKELDDAAETYHEAKTERVALSRQEDAAKDALIDKMKQHGMSRYETPDGLLVILTDTANVKTRRKSEEKPSENGTGSSEEETE